MDAAEDERPSNRPIGAFARTAIEEYRAGSSGRHWRVQDGNSRNTLVLPQRFSANPGMFSQPEAVFHLGPSESAPNGFSLSDRAPAWSRSPSLIANVLT